MKKLHYLLILDKSGSMDLLKDVFIKTVNHHFDEVRTVSKQYKRKAVFSVYFFDSKLHCMYNKVSAEELLPLSREDYTPSGSTALYDAIGLNLMPYLSKKRKEKLCCSIFTDGMENSSRAFGMEQVSDLIKSLNKSKHHWVRFFCSDELEGVFSQQLDIGESLEPIFLDESGFNNMVNTTKAQFHQQLSGINGK